MILLLFTLFLLFNGIGVYSIIMAMKDTAKKSVLTTQDKLRVLYGVRNEIHPFTQMMIVQFVEGQGSVLAEHDKEFIEDIWPEYENRLRNKI